MKKIISIFLTTSLVLSMSAVFASAEENDYSTEVEFISEMVIENDADLSEEEMPADESEYEITDIGETYALAPIEDDFAISDMEVSESTDTTLEGYTITEIPGELFAAATVYDPQKVVAYAKSKVGNSYANGYCLRFVKECFANTYGFTSSACCAYSYSKSYIDSTSSNNIPIGADVFFKGSSSKCSKCGNKCGHIGIYVGDGYVIHAMSGKVQKTKLSKLDSYSNLSYIGWGWHGNKSFSRSNGSSNNSISWPTTSNIKTYVISTGNDTTVYKTATSTTKYGTIYANDLITILGCSGSRLKVQYPLDTGGTKTGYIDKSKVTSAAINKATAKKTASGQITTYRRSGGSAELGYISRGDVYYIIASKNGRTQVIYPLSSGNGYKMGWIN